MFTLRRGFSAAVLVAMLAVAGCGSKSAVQPASSGSNNSGSTTKVLKIGAIATTSGPSASMGKEGLSGLEYGVKMVNSAGGVKIGSDTYTLQLINLDDESKAEKAVANAVKLITSEKVPVIFGPPASTATLAILPTTEKNKTLTITTIAASPDIIKPEFSYSIRVSVDSLQTVNPSVEFLMKDKGAKKIAYLGRNDDWGRSAGKGVVAKVKELGGTMVAEQYFDPGTSDFYGLLTKVKDATPDAVLVSTIVEDGVPFIKQYRELKIPATVLNLGVIWSSPNFIGAAEKSADGAFVATSAQTAETTEIRTFNDEFQKAMGFKSQSFDKTGYDGLMFLLEAMKQAGTAGDTTKIRDTMLKLQYKGVLQTYKFNGTGQSEMLININEIKGGKATPVKSLQTK